MAFIHRRFLFFNIETFLDEWLLEKNTSLILRIHFLHEIRIVISSWPCNRLYSIDMNQNLRLRVTYRDLHQVARCRFVPQK